MNRFSFLKTLAIIIASPSTLFKAKPKPSPIQFGSRIWEQLPIGKYKSVYTHAKFKKSWTIVEPEVTEVYYTTVDGKDSWEWQADK